MKEIIIINARSRSDNCLSVLKSLKTESQSFKPYVMTSIMSYTESYMCQIIVLMTSAHFALKDLIIKHFRVLVDFITK